jgi:hypothetical protein
MKKREEIARMIDLLLEESSPQVIKEGLQALKFKCVDMTPSKRKESQSEIEGQLETALQKYFQIQSTLDNPIDHARWNNMFRKALEEVIRANRADTNKGYWFSRDQVTLILDSVANDAWALAERHLNQPATRPLANIK